MKLNAKTRLQASSWQGRFIDMPGLPEVVIEAITATMTKLSGDYPSIAHVNVAYGDPDWLRGALATKSNTVVYLNEEYWTDLEKFAKVAKDWHEARVTTDFAGVIIHEVGHILTSQVLTKLGARKFNALLEKYLGAGNFDSIPNWVSPSAYGQENVSEFTAEAFASFYLGRHAMESPNELNLQAVTACRELWTEFNKVLHGKPRNKKAL